MRNFIFILLAGLFLCGTAQAADIAGMCVAEFQRTPTVAHYTNGCEELTVPGLDLVVNNVSASTPLAIYMDFDSDDYDAAEICSLEWTWWWDEDRWSTSNEGIHPDLITDDVNSEYELYCTGSTDQFVPAPSALCGSDDIHAPECVAIDAMFRMCMIRPKDTHDYETDGPFVAHDDWEYFWGRTANVGSAGSTTKIVGAGRVSEWPEYRLLRGFHMKEWVDGECVDSSLSMDDTNTITMEYPPVRTEPAGDYFGLCVGDASSSYPDCNELEDPVVDGTDTALSSDVDPGDSVYVYLDYDNTNASPHGDICELSWTVWYADSVWDFNPSTGGTWRDELTDPRFSFTCTDTVGYVLDRPGAECPKCNRSVTCTRAVVSGAGVTHLYTLNSWEAILTFTAHTSPDAVEGDTFFAGKPAGGFGSTVAAELKRWEEPATDVFICARAAFLGESNLLEATIAVDNEADGQYWRLCDAGVDGDCVNPENGDTVFATTFDDAAIGDYYVKEGDTFKLGLDYDEVASGDPVYDDLCRLDWAFWFDPDVWSYDKSDVALPASEEHASVSCAQAITLVTGPDPCPNCTKRVYCSIEADATYSLTTQEGWEAMTPLVADTDVTGFLTIIGEETATWHGGSASEWDNGVCTYGDTTTAVTNNVRIPVPEPATLVMLAAGILLLCGLFCLRRGNK